MGNVLQETTEAELTRSHIERRVDDWAMRVDSLYSQINSWLPPGWTTDRARTVRMREALMQKFGLSARELPILDLIQDSRLVASIEPRGLWIVGANGRLDFTRNGERYLITDESDVFGQPSWRISAFSNRGQTEPFDRGKLLALL